MPPISEYRELLAIPARMIEYELSAEKRNTTTNEYEVLTPYSNPGNGIKTQSVKLIVNKNIGASKNI
jgi:hypothetical protein